MIQNPQATIEKLKKENQTLKNDYLALQEDFLHLLDILQPNQQKQTKLLIMGCSETEKQRFKLIAENYGVQLLFSAMGNEHELCSQIRQADRVFWSHSPTKQNIKEKQAFYRCCSQCKKACQDIKPNSFSQTLKKIQLIDAIDQIND